MKLTGKQYKELTEALKSAFPTKSALKQMLQFTFDENLEIIVEDGSLETIIFELVQKFKAEGRISELIQFARKENPKNSDLITFEKKLNQKNSKLPLLGFIWSILGIAVVGILGWYVHIHIGVVNLPWLTSLQKDNLKNPSITTTPIAPNTENISIDSTPSELTDLTSNQHAVNSFSSPVKKAEQEVIAQGFAAGEFTKVQLRNMAKEDARRNALEKVVGVFISSEIVLENFELIHSKIYSQAQGFAQFQEIISEGYSEGIYAVQARFSVRTLPIETNLKQIVRGNDDPRVMIAITEQNIGSALNLYPLVSSYLKKLLIEIGYSVIETGNVIPNFSDPESTAADALRLGADLAMLVNIQILEGKNIPDQIHSAGKVIVYVNSSIDLVEMTTSRVVFSDVKGVNAEGLSLEAASLQGIERSLAYFREEIIKVLDQWVQGAGQENKIYAITIEGLDSYTTLGMFVDYLESKDALANVVSFYEGKAILEVNYRGYSDVFISYVIEYVEETFASKVVRVQGNSITIQSDSTDSETQLF